MYISIFMRTSITYFTSTTCRAMLKDACHLIYGWLHTFVRSPPRLYCRITIVYLQKQKNVVQLSMAFCVFNKRKLLRDIKFTDQERMRKGWQRWRLWRSSIDGGAINVNEHIERPYHMIGNTNWSKGSEDILKYKSTYGGWEKKHHNWTCVRSHCLQIRPITGLACSHHAFQSIASLQTKLSLLTWPVVPCQYFLFFPFARK